MVDIERAIEILDPEHREHYESIEVVNEACRMGMEALRRLQQAHKGKYVSRNRVFVEFVAWANETGASETQKFSDKLRSIPTVVLPESTEQIINRLDEERKKMVEDGIQTGTGSDGRTP